MQFPDVSRFGVGLTQVGTLTTLRFRFRTRFARKTAARHISRAIIMLARGMSVIEFDRGDGARQSP